MVARSRSGTGRNKSRAPRERVIEVLLLAAELGSIVSAVWELETSDAAGRDARYYATKHTRELMIAGSYTTYNEALRSAAKSLANGADALQQAARLLEIDAEARADGGGR